MSTSTSASGEEVPLAILRQGDRGTARAEGWWTVCQQARVVMMLADLAQVPERR
jgi:hypothetical protein